MTNPRLDRRLLAAGLTVTVADLVAVFIDHQPGQAATCGACGHYYTTAAPYCPSMVMVRGLLAHRHAENRDAFEPIEKAFKARDTRVLPTAAPRPDPAGVPSTAVEAVDLFAIDAAWRKPRPPRWAA